MVVEVHSNGGRRFKAGVHGNYNMVVNGPCEAQAPGADKTDSFKHFI